MSEGTDITQDEAFQRHREQAIGQASGHGSVKPVVAQDIETPPDHPDADHPGILPSEQVEDKTQDEAPMDNSPVPKRPRKKEDTNPEV